MNVTITVPDEIVDVIVEIVLARIDASADRRDAPEYLGVKDAATYLGCTEGRVRKLVERRQIPFSQDGPGCRVFISRSDLESFMQAQRQGGRQ